MSDFVTIATYDNYVAASFNKQKLDNEGFGDKQSTRKFTVAMGKSNKRQKLVRLNPAPGSEEWSRRLTIIRSLSASAHLLKKGEILRHKLETSTVSKTTSTAVKK